MYLSYSGYNKYRSCPRAYWHGYINKTKSPKPDNRVHMLYGEAVGHLFEAFYNEQLWKQKRTVSKTLLARVEDTLRKIIAKETSKGGILDWSEKGLKEGNRSLEEVTQEVRDTIPRALRTIQDHRLLGRDAAAEVVLDIVTNGHKIAGRSDFIMNRACPDKDLVLLDGKGSRWRDKYTSNSQLLWYAMLYRLKFKVVPDRVAFVYWRYESDKSVDWSEVHLKDLISFQTGVLQTIADIEQARKDLVQLRPKDQPGMVFWANPGSDCQLCNFQPLCPEGNRPKVPKDAARGVGEGDFSF